MFRNLGSFIEALRQRGEVVEIDVEVDPALEMAEIHRRVIASDGPALLFKNVKNKQFPVVTNLFGTKERVDLAFGQDAKAFVQRLASLPEEALPPTPSKIWGLRDLAWKATKIGYRRQRRAPVMECEIANADPTMLPAITSWQKDGGPFLTLPLVHTLGDEKKPDNLGMYRIQIHDQDETGVHFQIGKGGGFHLYEAEKENRQLPMNIYLGGPPALILAAIAPLPENVPELMLASLVMGEKLGRGSISGHPIHPIAEAEFCLSGFVPPHVRRPEGPFGDHYGYYSLQHDYPVFRPQRIFHRKNAIFPATVVGKPRQEDFYLGDYLTELLSPLFPVVMPGIVSLWSYGETGYHALSAAVLKERYHRESMASAFRVLGEGQLSLTKFLICVDRPMDLTNFREVFAYMMARVDWRRDLYIFSELSMDTLDYTGPSVNKGSKGVVIAMGEPVRSLPKDVPSDLPGGLIKHARQYVPGCLVVSGVGFEDDPELGAKIVGISQLAEFPLIVLVDDVDKTLINDATFLWTTFTRFEPAADIHAKGQRVIRNHISYEGPILIDARMKPWYPEELFCDERTAETVTKRWREYFPKGDVIMGDSAMAHLTAESRW